jgi:hypothetical protein
MRLSPEVWGPFFWHTLHIVSIGYPKEPTYTDKRAAKEFYEALAHLLPCSVCREHYRAHLAESPITPFLDTRTDLIKWVLLIHNKVNKAHQKPEWTLEQLLLHYERLGRRNRSPVWRKEDMDEVDYRSYVKGFLTAVVIAGVAGGAYVLYTR